MRNNKATLDLARAVERYERAGLSLGQALRTIMLDSAAGWYTRGQAARLLAVTAGASVADELIQQFFAQTEEIELWETALTMESFGDTGVVAPLIPALHDENHHRRHAAARALGWIWGGGSPAVNALIDALADPSQPLAVREEAAESLAYHDSTRAIPTLIAALQDSETGIRFWSVFALGSIRNRKTGRHTDRRAVPALEAMLHDDNKPPGNWWSIAREALAMLGNLDPPEPRYRDQLNTETQRVLSDPNASADDRRWAESYFRSAE
jgi:HEAT repeat protein